MRVRAIDGRHIVRLESGEPVIATLIEYLEGLQTSGFTFANVSGAGAVSGAELGYWQADSKTYRYRAFDEQLEVVSFQGNASLKDGRPFLHLHVVLGRADFTTVGGHLREATAHPTLEVWLRAERIEISRAKDPASGLDLLDLPET